MLLIQNKPIKNPPIWAKNAIGLPPGPPVDDNICKIIHIPSHKNAGTSITQMNGIPVNILDNGYNKKYAPIIPAIAPDAPTIGIFDNGESNICTMDARMPQAI